MNLRQAEVTAAHRRWSRSRKAAAALLGTRGAVEDKDKQFSERFYGRFERRIPLGVEVEENKIDARFKNGVLNIVLPKSAKAQSQVKRIAIKS